MANNKQMNNRHYTIQLKDGTARSGTSLLKLVAEVDQEIIGAVENCGLIDINQHPTIAAHNAGFKLGLECHPSPLNTGKPNLADELAYALEAQEELGELIELEGELAASNTMGLAPNAWAYLPELHNALRQIRDHQLNYIAELCEREVGQGQAPMATKAPAASSSDARINIMWSQIARLQDRAAGHEATMDELENLVSNLGADVTMLLNPDARNRDRAHRDEIVRAAKSAMETRQSHAAKKKAKK